MIKRLLVTLVAFMTVFLTQSQVWAAVNKSDKVAESINLSIDKSTFLVSDEAPAIIARRDSRSENPRNPQAWVASIFIAGLGQIFMGNFWRGFIFTLLFYGNSIALVFTFFSNLRLKTGSDGFDFYQNSSFLASLSYLFLLLVPIIYIWNIIDAYSMSKEISDISKLDSEELTKLKKDLMATVDFIQNTKVSNNGTVSFKALAF